MKTKTFILMFFVIIVVISAALFITDVSLSSWPKNEVSNAIVITSDQQQFNILYNKIHFPKTSIMLNLKDTQNEFLIGGRFDKGSQLYNELESDWNKIEYVKSIDGIKIYKTPWCILYSTTDGYTAVLYSDYKDECSRNPEFAKIYEAVK